MRLPLNRLVSLSVLCLLSTHAPAQGVLPLSGKYAFGMIGGGYPSGTLTAFVRSGTFTFASNGTFSATGSEHRLYANGTFADFPFAAAGSYAVATSGTLTLTFVPPLPGTANAALRLRPDGQVAVGANVDPVEASDLLVLVQLSSGQSNASASGAYHMVELVQGTDLTGISTLCGFGTVTFSGTGSFTASQTEHLVLANGSTSNGTGGTTAPYSIAPDGTFSSPPFQGAVSKDGEMGFATRADGPNAQISIVVRKGSANPIALLAGNWGAGTYRAKPGLFVNGPGFTSESSTYGFTATGAATANWSASGTALNVAPGSAAAQALSMSGTASLATTGDLTLLQAGGSVTGESGGVSVAGTLALATDLYQNGATSIRFLIRQCPWPTTYGTGTAGTGNLVPSIGNAGGFPYVGNAGFGIAVGNGRGGSAVALGLSAGSLPGFPFLGGKLWIDPQSLVTVVVPLSGNPGAAGAGSATISLPIPRWLYLGGASVDCQGFIADPSAPRGLSMTAGLQVTLSR